MMNQVFSQTVFFHTPCTPTPILLLVLLLITVPYPPQAVHFSTVPAAVAALLPPHSPHPCWQQWMAYCWGWTLLLRGAVAAIWLPPGERWGSLSKGHLIGGGRDDEDGEEDDAHKRRPIFFLFHTSLRAALMHTRGILHGVMWVVFYTRRCIATT